MGRNAFATPAAALILALAGCGAEETTTVTAGGSGARDDGGSKAASDASDRPRRERPALAASDRRKLERFAATAPGELGIVVSPLGPGEPVAVGDARRGRAWSTMKVPLLVALLDRVGGAGELSEEERAQAEAALSASDNDAALALFDRLQALEGGLVPASRAIDAVLRRSGDEETNVNTEPSPEGFSTFGQTIWSARGSARFFGALASGCLLGREDTDLVLSALERVVPDQRWGLGEAPTPGGASVAFKGGWGPEPGGGYLVRQTGVVRKGEAGYVVSIVAVPDETGSAAFPAGQDLVSEAARVVAEGAGAGPAAPLTCER